jgi:teichuronic acid exporter
MIRTKVLHSLKWLASTTLIGKALATVISVFVIRLLEPTDYGLMAMALVFVGLLALLNEMGLGAALVQKKSIAHGEIEKVFGLLLIVNLSLYAVLYLAAPWVAAFFREPNLVPVLRVLSLLLPMTALIVVPRAMLQREMNFRAISLVELAHGFAAGFGTLAFALAGFGVWSLIFGSLLGTAVQIAGIHIAAKMLILPRFSLQGMRQQVIFGGYLTADRVLWYLYSRSDVVIVGRIIGPELLGFYHVAQKLASLPLQMFGNIGNQIGFAAYSRVQDDKPRLALYYCKAARMATFFSFPFCFGLSVVAPEAVTLVLGPKWMDVILPLQIVALAVPLRNLNTLNTPALLAIGRPEVNVVNLSVALAVMPAAFLFASGWGLVGVASVWVLVYPLYLLFVLMRSLPILGVSWRMYLTSVWPAAAAAAIMFGVVEVARQALLFAEVHAVVVLAVSVMLGGCVYIGAIWMLRRDVVREVLQLAKA